ncbi:MAG: nitrous oxide reductase family maturation protein NosD [Candidatus Thiodiazotropha lotti]|uniref:nitrous oxide reductase family maturation protein NosD n=1 Tax=Candidatus Thiodiazotropha endoloripes TaxID=1818881 RepID=UPI0009F6D05A|nr:nitrous oxide reductase family maturation protein NosD [Candidatus Thiodiazotropha endoloripes]MCG7903961.1 nitrous oxide reductase family maturation protein NosD [Candidatus Thiodiazotropha weberae]MCG7992121.1 nitrous oxide reductase family maturation protein NosD [Candidatus Thiodiazotropha lotti]MCG7998625.1 nitrous oxide reductase family maturation protein NosD [Candidatus Thiodiazotropha lotti]MCW4183779.1 nitrous oxide reductase family maturation protein NosD [Candidatus Thiodiazotrop
MNLKLKITFYNKPIESGKLVVVNAVDRQALLSVALLLLLSITVSYAFASTEPYPSFQTLVDNTEPGGILIPPPGTYAGPVTISDAITVDGQGKVTIDAGGKGSVVVLDTDGATIKNLHLTNSGESHNTIDSGVQVRGDFNVIKDNVIDNCLFGVDLQQSKNNIVRANRISSKPFDLGIRGDAIRLWYSFDNKITDNIIRDSRDMVVWYSRDNLIARNDARGGRYSLHFMYAQYNEVVGNHYEDNSVGIFVMYSDGVHLKNNYIAHATGATGMGIGFKETSDVVVTGNQILYCATGLYLDVSPYQPDTVNRFENNLVAYSGIGVLFLNDWTGNTLKNNRFKGNITQVAVSGGGKTANRNLWQGNYWDDYEGFDQNRDQVGDKPYELFSYADRIWMDVPSARFFKGSPVLEVMDFLERLAPFTQPNMLVRDEQPMMSSDLAEQVASVDEPDQVTPVVNETEIQADTEETYDAYRALRESLGR